MDVAFKPLSLRGRDVQLLVLSGIGTSKYELPNGAIGTSKYELPNGAPFAGMPDALEQLQAILLRRCGGDAVRAQVPAAVPIHELDAVLVPVESALEAGKPSGEHVLNRSACLASDGLRVSVVSFRRICSKSLVLKI